MEHVPEIKSLSDGEHEYSVDQPELKSVNRLLILGCVSGLTLYMATLICFHLLYEFPLSGHEEMYKTDKELIPLFRRQQVAEFVDEHFSSFEACSLAQENDWSKGWIYQNQYSELHTLLVRFFDLENSTCFYIQDALNRAGRAGHTLPNRLKRIRLSLFLVKPQDDDSTITIKTDVSLWEDGEIHIDGPDIKDRIRYFLPGVDFMGFHSNSTLPESLRKKYEQHYMK